LKLADYCITEAGFGADLGAEQFFDIKCRQSGLKPDAVVLVATVRALKYNGGVAKDDLSNENLDALKAGIENLGKHIENIQSFGLPVVVALNAFVSDTDAEIAFVKEYCASKNCTMSVARVWEKGGEGGTELAELVIEAAESGKAAFKTAYEDDLPIREKIETVAKNIYGADGVEFSSDAIKQIKKIEDMGFGKFPVCMAKTQYSLSDDQHLLGRPTGFRVHVREVYVSAGAGFVVALTGSIMTMPGLSKSPAAYKIDVDENGKITGLF
jgi:formate--tetrahydrofolate ligase